MGVAGGLRGVPVAIELSQLAASLNLPAETVGAVLRYLGARTAARTGLVPERFAQRVPAGYASLRALTDAVQAVVERPARLDSRLRSARQLLDVAGVCGYALGRDLHDRPYIHVYVADAGTGDALPTRIRGRWVLPVVTGRFELHAADAA